MNASGASSSRNTRNSDGNCSDSDDDSWHQNYYQHNVIGTGSSCRNTDIALLLPTDENGHTVIPKQEASVNSDRKSDTVLMRLLGADVNTVKGS